MLEITVYSVALAGFLLVLVKSSIYAIDSIVKFCKATRISELGAGFVIIAISTNMPEIAVTLFSSYSHNIQLAVGNSFGSNVANIAFIAALFLFLSPIKQLERKTVRGIFPLLIAFAIPVLFLVIHQGNIIIGILLLGVFSMFVYHSLQSNQQKSVTSIVLSSYRKPLLSFLVGIAFVIISSRMVVTSASLIAESTGIGEVALGATIIAIGTSLPELTVDIVAARKRHIDLALGDIIGSSVTNVTLILGLAIVTSAVQIDFVVFNSIIIFAAVAPLTMFMFLRTGHIKKWHSVSLLLIYAIFLFVIYGIQAMAK